LSAPTGKPSHRGAMFLRQNLTPPPSIGGEQTLDLVGLDQDPTKTVNLLKRRTPTPPPPEAGERGPQTAAAMETPSDGRDVEGLFFWVLGLPRCGRVLVWMPS
jgi:hypothetical protein